MDIPARVYRTSQLELMGMTKIPVFTPNPSCDPWVKGLRLLRQLSTQPFARPAANVNTGRINLHSVRPAV